MSSDTSALSQVIFAAHSACLRNPIIFTILTRFLFARAETANMVRDLVTAILWNWHASGGCIVTATGEVLDIERMERLGEAFVYSSEGNVIYLEPGIPLVRLDDAFRENTRRTLNRMKEKLRKPCTKRVDKRLLPLVFWLDVAKKIIEHEEPITHSRQKRASL